MKTAPENRLRARVRPGLGKIRAPARGKTQVSNSARRSSTASCTA